jgi:DNA-binding CsgD family transcriptional regulator
VLEREALTRQERKVAVLLRRGLSNAEIAERLVVEVGTVKVHVHHILGKLGMRSRAEVAAWVADRAKRQRERESEREEKYIQRYMTDRVGMGRVGSAGLQRLCSGNPLNLVRRVFWKDAFMALNLGSSRVGKTFTGRRRFGRVRGRPSVRVLRMADIQSDCEWDIFFIKGPNIGWIWSPPGGSAFGFTYRWTAP